MNVLPHNKFEAINFTHAISEFTEGQEQVTSRIIKPFPHASDRKTLAWASALQNINATKRSQVIIADLCDVAKIRDSVYWKGCVCWFPRGTEPVFPPRSEPPLSMVF